MIKKDMLNKTIDAIEEYIDLVSADNKAKAGELQTVLNFWRMYKSVTAALNEYNK